MMDATFILKRTQLAHDSSQPHLTNKPSKCIQPSSSDTIYSSETMNISAGANNFSGLDIIMGTWICFESVFS